ncbi:MAG: carbohydrate-binding domain-containing protein [Coriobacteriales bacterium]|jgi:hypothetical protein|nr:carbohydrate-binding domain-containing protein [Coriobacteriales bacterium]
MMRTSTRTLTRTLTRTFAGAKSKNASQLNMINTSWLSWIQVSKHPAVYTSLLALVFIITLAFSMLLGGCASNQATGSDNTQPSTTVTPYDVFAPPADAATMAPGTAGSASVAATTPNSGNDAYDFELTTRDQDASYSTSSATTIQFSGSSVTVAGTNSSAVQVSGTIATIGEEGTYIVSGSCSNGQLAVNAIAEGTKVQLVLDGLTLSNSNDAALLVEQADKVFITLAPNSSSVLGDNSQRNDVSLTDDDETTSTDTTSDATSDGTHESHNATLFAHDDLTINGTGSLVVSSVTHGISCKDDLAVADGDIQITAAGDGLKGKDSVIIAGGTLNISADDDGIVSTQTDQAYEKGFVSINSGSIKVSAKDDGLHAETIARLAGGSLTITKSYEGIEGAQIWILGGEHSVTSSDDGLNAAGSARTDFLLSIQGGNIFVNAEGDGLDSNGTLIQSGGNVVVNGPTRSGNGALDANSATISGGTILAADSGGMSMSFASTSAQPALIYRCSQSLPANTVLSITNSAGKTIISYTAAKQFSTLTISSSDIQLNEQYSIIINGEKTTDFTLTEQSSVVAADGSVSAYSGQGGMGGMGGMGETGGGMGRGAGRGGGRTAYGV